jgi:hypothetical protein
VYREVGRELEGGTVAAFERRMEQEDVDDETEVEEFERKVRGVRFCVDLAAAEVVWRVMLMTILS